LSAIAPALKVRAPQRRGIGFWMSRVLAEAAHATRELSPDAVHDLRVALRRCRTLADTMGELDAHPAWQEMDAAARRLFRRLGPLRDADVMAGWLEKVAPAEDLVRQALEAQLLAERDAHRRRAQRALRRFDRAEWRGLRQVLVRRAGRVPAGGAVFQHLALERWTEARALHSAALRTRSAVALHRLRVGLKRLRYIVENCLPKLHVAWGGDLKQFQDWLGEIHDLDVLRAALPGTGLLDGAAKKRWHSWLESPRGERLSKYRERMGGRKPLWPQWRAALPAGRAEQKVCKARWEAWALFQGSARRHLRRVARISSGLLRGLKRARFAEHFADPAAERILAVASLVHAAGRASGKRGHHKTAYRLIRGLRPPLGWTPEETRQVALVARYHRGKPPAAHHEGFAELDETQRAQVCALAGVLRIAEALATAVALETRTPRVRVSRMHDVLLVRVSGLHLDEQNAARLARRKMLLETLLELSIVVTREEGKPQLIPAAVNPADPGGGTPATPSA